MTLLNWKCVGWGVRELILGLIVTTYARSVGHRYDHQGMNRMVAVDAFIKRFCGRLNTKLRRVNIPRDRGNWCADEDRVYAAVGDDCVIDAATGEMLHTVEPPEGYQDGFDWGYVAATEDFVVGTVVPSGGLREFWDKPSWQGQ